MKYTYFTFKGLMCVGFLSVFLVLVSCNKNTEIELEPLVSQNFKNLSAVQTTDYSVNPPVVLGDYVKFSFAKGEIVTGNDWDIAFRGTTILVNGGKSSASDQPERTGNAGAYIASGTLESIISINTDLFSQDTENQYAIQTGSGNGWYNYAGAPTHLITPIAGKILVIRTHDNRFAKVEILSYYKDAPAAPTGEGAQHYTFSYIYQPNENKYEF